MENKMQSVVSDFVCHVLFLSYQNVLNPIYVYNIYIYIYTSFTPPTKLLGLKLQREEPLLS